MKRPTMIGGEMVTTMATGPTSHGIGTHGKMLSMDKLIIFRPPQEEDPSEDPALQDSMQAEKEAEALALQAQRTWSEAQRATAQLRKDRGF